MEYLKQNDKIVYYKDIPILKRIDDFPCDYNGPIYITFSAVITYRNEFIFAIYENFDTLHKNGFCDVIDKNRYEVYKQFYKRNKNIFCGGIRHMRCYKVYLRDDKYFQDLNETAFRGLYAVKKNGTDAKLEDYIKEEKN